MTEQFLHGTDVVAILEQMRGKTVPEAVRSDALRDTGPPAAPPTRADESERVDPTADRDRSARRETQTARPSPWRRWDTCDPVQRAVRPAPNRRRDPGHAVASPPA